MNARITTISICLSATFLILLPFSIELRADESKTVDLDDLTITIPSNWSQFEEDDTILTALGPLVDQDDTFTENLRLKIHPINRDISLDDILDAQIKDAENSDFNVIRQGELQVGSDRFVWYATTPKTAPADEVLLAMINYMTIRSRRGYVAHCMCEADQLDTYLPQFETIVRSIAFKAPANSVSNDTDRRSNDSAYEGGRKVGKIVAYILIAVIVASVLKSILRKLIPKKQ